MGRLIDVGDLHNAVMLNKSDWGVFATPIDQLVESLVSQVSTVEAIPKADYENRLKADLVAMLTEIQMEIDELEVPLLYLAEDYEGGVLDCKKIIQQKINELPSVTPIRPKGHWMDTNDNEFVPFRVYKCSHCGATFCDYPKNLKKYKYCSDCGAKMGEPQESEG